MYLKNKNEEEVVVKFCGNCGSELPDDVVFCSNCGAKAEGSQGEPQGVREEMNQPVNQTVQEENKTNVKEKLPKSKKTKFIIAGAAALLVLIIGIVTTILVVSSIKKTIHVEEFVYVDFYGGNGSGMAEAYIDEYSFLDSVMDAAGMKVNYEELLESEDLIYENEEFLLIYDLYESIEFELDKDSGLSNGDSVTVTCTYDKAVTKQLGIKIKDTEVTFKVENLEELVDIDPFEYLTVEFIGTAPYISVDLSYTGNDGYLSVMIS
jgi:uncharacterized Zn finger protein (UPF0148 family)